MKIEVHVTPKSRRPSLIKKDDGPWIVKVTEPPEDNRANKAVIEAVAGYLKVPKSCVRIISGLRSRHKVVGINE